MSSQSPPPAPNPRGPNASSEGVARFLSTLGRARRTLRRVATLEVILGAAVGGLLCAGMALLLVDALPYSLGLRYALWALIVVGPIAGGALFIWRRVLPLGQDTEVARGLERAARANGRELSGAVRGAVELLEKTGESGESEDLVAAHIAATGAALLEVGAQRSVRAVALQAARRTVLAAAVTAASAVLVGVLATDVVQARFAKLFDDEAARRALEAEALNLVPLVTDLELTLRFPAYMGREDQHILGSSGDVLAPRGTEVFLKGRADRLLRAAALIYDEQDVALEVEGGREIRGTFVVDRAGSYRFRLEGVKGGTELSPVARKISLVPDEAPEVQLLAPDEDRVVQLDEEIPLSFSAEDDYGISGLFLVVRRQGSGASPSRRKLVELNPSLREYRDKATFTPESVGARPGDRLSIHIEADDNDTVGGPKAGRSVTRVLTVFSPAEHHRELIELQERLLDAMVDVLADELDAPISTSVSKTDVVEQRGALSVQTQPIESGGAMVVLLDRVMDHLAEDKLAPDELRRTLVNVRADLVRPYANKKELVENSLAALVRKEPVRSYAFRQARGYQQELTEKLEKHIVYLEDLISTQKIAEAEQIADEVRRTQEALKELMAKYKESPDDETRNAILAEIRRMQQQLQSLLARLASLQRDVPDEFLNTEAFESDRMMTDANSLDQMIEEGRLDDAMQALERMLEQTEKLLDGLDESREEYGSDEYAELREKLRDFGEELTGLKAEQEQLARKSERMLESARKEAMRKLKNQLQSTLKDLKEKVAKANKALTEVDPAGLFLPEQEEAAYAKARLDDLEAALEQEDLEDALEAAFEARGAARAVERAVSDRTRGRFGTKNPKTTKARDLLEEARPLVDEAYETLNEILPDPASMLSKSQRAEMQRDAKRQGELKKRADALARKMQDISNEMPLFSPEHQGQISKAGEEMQKAGRQLAGEDIRRGRGSQRRALGALEQLQQSLEQMQQQSQGQGGIPLPLPLPGGGQNGGRDGNGHSTGDEEVKIPGAEEYQVPDAFRRDILDAMRESAPEEWEREVRRYYEELVK